MAKKKIQPKLLLDVGCGQTPQQGYVGMDKRKLPGVDIVHDCERVPWPIESGSVNVVLMSHLIEHINPQKNIPVMDECYRVLSPDGLLIMATPYAGSFRFWQDPTHCNGWNEATVHYFIKGSGLYDIYKPKPWKLEKMAFSIQGDLEVALRPVKNGNRGNKAKSK